MFVEEWNATVDGQYSLVCYYLRTLTFENSKVSDAVCATKAQTDPLCVKQRPSIFVPLLTSILYRLTQSTEQSKQKLLCYTRKKNK